MKQLKLLHFLVVSDKMTLDLCLSCQNKNTDYDNVGEIIEYKNT